VGFHDLGADLFRRHLQQGHKDASPDTHPGKERPPPHEDEEVEVRVLPLLSPCHGSVDGHTEEVPTQTTR